MPHVSAPRKQREPSPAVSEYESLVSESEDDFEQEDEEEEEEEVAPPPPTPKAGRKRKLPNSNKETAAVEVKRKKASVGEPEDVVDLATDEVRYPPKTYRLSKRSYMRFGTIKVDPCKKTGKAAYEYEGLELKRVDDDSKKKKKPGVKNDWSWCANANLTPKIQEASTRAMIAAGQTPYTG